MKNYGKVEAVKGVTFSVERGKCFGLLGPNGAGKTTTIEVIEDVISPTSGEILYKQAPRSASFREEVGIQFQQTALLGYMTIRETLQTFKSLYRNTEEIEDLAELCYLQEFLDQMNDKISGGQKQRFFLALALVNKPELVILDEPSTGLDPIVRRDILTAIIRTVADQGRTVLKLDPNHPAPDDHV